MRSLVIGASGQVGGWLLARCRDRQDACLGTCFRHSLGGLVPLDIRDAQAVETLVRQHLPEVVFLPAALTHVDYAESHQKESRAINVEGTAHVARAVQSLGGLLVFFSTDYVFPDSAVPYTEEAPCVPCNVYARTKAEGEGVVRNLLPDRHLILRTSWVYGPKEQGKNFVYRAVRTLRQGERLTVPRDQFGQPTYAPDLAATALELASGGHWGTFHVVGPAHLNRLAFAELISQVFSLDPKGIKGVGSAELGPAAPRPHFICLSRDKLLAALGRDPIRPPRQALEVIRDGPAQFRP